jgi:very-short-patch-repair endonuclease
MAFKKAPLLLKEGWTPFYGGRGGYERRFRAVRRKTRNTMKLKTHPDLKTFRRELRANLTPAEATLWTMLKGAQLEGHKFRRQHSVGPYILDFYSNFERLGIELDGQVHVSDEARQYDYERSLFLEFYGIKVIRFENKWVFEEPMWVLDQIKSHLAGAGRSESADNADP